MSGAHNHIRKDNILNLKVDIFRGPNQHKKKNKKLQY